MNCKARCEPEDRASPGASGLQCVTGVRCIRFMRVPVFLFLGG